ncbi:hypothetical protein X777_09931, partial [Ooceraea biroi]
PYSSDLAPGDFHFFPKFKQFLENVLDDELQLAINNWLNELTVDDYNNGILKLVHRYDKCLNEMKEIIVEK